MKLTKRIAAGLLAVAMMATMAAPAFALDGAGTTPTTPTTSTVTNYKGNSTDTTTSDKYAIPKNLVAPKDWKFEAETYTLTAEQQSVSSGTSWNNVTGSLPTFTNVEVKATSGIEQGKADFEVTLPTYTHTGKYVYKITESTESGNKQQGEAYADPFYMQVQVTAHQNASGEVVNDAFDVYVKFSTSATNFATDKTDTTEGKIGEVTNTIKTNTTPDPDPDEPGTEQTGQALTITKVVKGNAKGTDNTPIDPSDEYTIELTLSAANGKTLSKSAIENNVTAAKGDNDPVTLTWTEVTGGYKTSVTLKNKETVSFKEIPEGAVYKVEETTESATGFTVTYNGNTTAATGTVSSEGNATTVTNTGNGTISIDTGVILDNAPYIVMIAVVAAAAVVFVISKKRREE